MFPALPGGRRGLRWRVAWTLALGLLLAAGPARAELRFSDRPEVFLNDYELTVQAVLLGAIPPAFHEHLHSGVTTHLRFYVELWQYSRFLPNERLHARMVERQISYNVVTKEYKVVSTVGERREPYVTKDLREAQRIASEIRGLKLGPASALDPRGGILRAGAGRCLARRGEHIPDAPDGGGRADGLGSVAPPHRDADAMRPGN